MDSVLAGVVLLLLASLHVVRGFAVAARFLVNSQSLPRENISLLTRIFGQAGVALQIGGFDVVQGWREVDINVGIDDAYSFVLIDRFDFQDIDLKLVAKDLDSDGVFFVETGEISELILKDSFRVVQIDKFGLMGLQFDHMADVAVLAFEVGDEGNGGLRAGLWKFEHPEHPVWDVA